MKNYQEYYSLLFISSLLLFLVNYAVQGQLLFNYSDSFGIIFKMNIMFWFGYILMLILVCFQYINFKLIDNRYAYLTLFLAILYLIATPFLYENLPRFEDTWGHSFLAQEIFNNKKVEIGISIYEQYPGSILFYGLLFNFIPSYYVMKFFPMLFYIFGILVIYSLFKNLLNEKTSFLISIIYIFLNWTVEDNHISPQFLVLNLYFLFMFITVKLLGEKKNMKKYLLALTLLGTVIVFSHSFTPVFLIFILGSVFLICKQFRLDVFPIIVMLLAIFITYTAFRTTTFGSIIKYTQSFIEGLNSGSNIGGATIRLETSLLSRQIFLASRIGITLISVVLGLMGIVLMRSRKYQTGANFFLAWSFSLIPFIIFSGLVLKGEFYERFALISSLPLAGLTAYFICEKKVRFSVIFVLLLFLTPLYFIAKYGNEAFESVSMEKLSANCFSYQYNDSCAKDFEVVDSPINCDIKNLGKTYFVTSREQNMACSALDNKNLDSILSSIDNQVQEYNLNRIYSTNSAAVYR